MNRVVCPYCRNSTDISNRSTCVYCGKRLKRDTKLELVKDKDKSFNIRNKDSNKSGCAFFVVILLVLVIVSSVIYNKIYTFYNKISKVNETMSTTVSQNDNFTLPSTVSVQMNSGKSKAVYITWDKQGSINTSDVGIQVFKGNIENYEKPIKYVLAVLPSPEVRGFYDVSTQNSIVNYNVPLKNNSKWIWFKISKDGELKNQVMPINDGIMKGKLYLNSGTGMYQIDVLFNIDNNEYGKYRKIQSFNINNTDKRDMRDLMPGRYIESESTEIIDLANEITKNSYSDMEKTKAIHDWVATNISYDVEALTSGNIKMYSALYTLHGKKAVCSGYANLTAALNRAVGIKTKVIRGNAKSSGDDKSGAHAWNETFVDNRWVIQDATWDAGGVDKKNQFKFKLTDKYFNPKIDEFKKDHMKEGETDE